MRNKGKGENIAEYEDDDWIPDSSASRDRPLRVADVDKIKNENGEETRRKHTNNAMIPK